MKIIQRDISELISAEYNPRQLTNDQFHQISDSIKRFGIVDPIIVNKHKDRKDIIVGGHQRVKVARDLDIKEVPTVEVSLTYEKERELNIRLNKNSGEWDFDLLANHFEIEELTDWGFNDGELVGFEAEEIKIGRTDDDAIPEDVEPECKLGDLYQLGEHRLLCGDATKKEDVDLLMNGDKADMVFTDPPYGINLETEYAVTDKVKGKKYRKVIGDDNDFDAGFILKHFDCDEVFLWGADYYCKTIHKGGSWVVWDKKKEGLDESIGSGFELCWSKKPHKRLVCRYLWSGFTAKEKNESRVHPTQKPIGLVLWFFERYKGNKVVDLFLGSGSTLIACEKTNRKCYGMEIDPYYCDVIVKRWEDFTGQKAELIGKT